MDQVIESEIRSLCEYWAMTEGHEKEMLPMFLNAAQKAYARGQNSGQQKLDLGQQSAQDRIDRAVAVLNRRFAGVGPWLPQYRSDKDNEVYQVYQILKGEA